MKTPNRHSGFSLVELLVVVAIIVVLLALLMPTLSSGKARAKQLRCASNMRQCHVILAQYAGDNDGWLPSGNSANPYTLLDREADKIDAYLRSASVTPDIWYCPSILEQMPELTLKMWNDRNITHYYCSRSETNLGYIYTVNPNRISLRKFQKPPHINRGDFFSPKTEWLADICAAFRPPSISQNGADITNWRTFPHNSRTKPKSSNVLYGDGSLLARPVSELTYSYRFYHAANLYW